MKQNNKNIGILFPSSYIDKKQCDENFYTEYLYACEWFNVYLFDQYKFETTGKVTLNKPLKNDKLIYRGWMFKNLTKSINSYEMFYNQLGGTLINNPVEYNFCHYSALNMKSIFENLIYEPIINDLSKEEKLDSICNYFSSNSNLYPIVKEVYIIKDFVKSAKDVYGESVLKLNIGDNFRDKIKKFIHSRSSLFDGGLVLKPFHSLYKITQNSQLEFRAFIINKSLFYISLNIGEDFDVIIKSIESQYIANATKFIFDFIEQNKIESNFYTIDLLVKENGEIFINELGDGQVSGIPHNNSVIFYRTLNTFMK